MNGLFVGGRPQSCSSDSSSAGRCLKQLGQFGRPLARQTLYVDQGGAVVQVRYGERADVVGSSGHDFQARPARWTGQ
jgi:hypothetical protein